MDMHFPDFSADLVRDIDICGIQLIDPDIRAGWKKMQDDCLSLIYSPRHGGHWMPMRAHVIERIVSDNTAFINGGVWVPPKPPGMRPQIPIQSDGDIDRGFRSLITPYLIGKPLPAAIGVAGAGNRSDLGC